jgi:3-hydroxyacyl-[acyl-carrier-protein] dehydratase
VNSLFRAVGECLEKAPEETASGEFEAGFVFPPAFPGFAGHFPGKPVLPGIAQIMAVIHACGVGTPPALRAVKSCKFLRPVAPGERIAVKGKKTGDGDGMRVTATLQAGEALCASMTLLVSARD